MKPKIFDYLFNDDRMFVLEISQVKVSNLTSAVEPQNKWAVITRRNVPGYPPHRSDNFNTYEEAKDFYHKIVVQTPRVSLGEKSPYPTPTIEQYKNWLCENNLYDPLLNPHAIHK
ncbi:MAG: hypothetical protein K9J16_00035 [Melioribacteraceae bacterium]|nr:hypothetical protein [Melioribacteraceae bacterium]MCF8353897.1 hypothetical protein [Melioribacteraceae bacterium]MCF8392654.1 hypothetical protein [Melioribacteraceae bacterium]MCF8417675.1 hypothetical protein [Melioribacteraceae bacterium]